MNERLQLMTPQGWRTVAQSDAAHLAHVRANMQSSSFAAALKVAADKAAEQQLVGMDELFDFESAIAGSFLPDRWRVIPAWTPGDLE